MCYNIPLHECNDLLNSTFQTLDDKLLTRSDLIHECVKFIISQYIARGVQVHQFVLLVDECIAIQDKLDPNDEFDIHSALRESLLTKPMVCS